jgi:hypothetical protein
MIHQLIALESNDYWVRIVDFLQQNWALIEENDSSDHVTIYFFGDTSGVFDILSYPCKEEAETALERNGFNQYLDLHENFKEFISCSHPPFHWREHPNGRIYSSGRYWRY